MGEYCFIEIPTEDIKLIQGLGLARFKLIETRMTYYLNNLNEFAYERFPVRKANISDIENLKRVAREMRNRYDRFHADNIFSNEISDEFLATFVEESIKGFADYVIVPNAKGVPPDAFLTAKYLKEDWSGIGANISKLVLSAVSSLTCKGWYIKLISEMIYHLRDVGTEYVFMHPSSTNKPIIHTYEKLGCKLGQVTLIFSFES
jgi:dTDP-4-amino-4,6-dideoxy-D-galactose acyltransferase